MNNIKFAGIINKFTLILIVIVLCLSCGCNNNQVDSSSQIDSASTQEDVFEKPTVTAYSQVGNNVCLLTGYCSLNTDKIVVSGENVVACESAPFAGKNKKYFTMQVNYTATTKIEVKAVDSNGNQTESVNVYISNKPMRNNYMYQGEYSPVFGGDGFSHFYSALLSYSLNTDKITDDMQLKAEENISKIIKETNKLGAEAIFVIIPSSADIYPETVPADFTETDGERLYERFTSIVEKQGAKVIYPYVTMMTHSNDGEGYQIYQHTDSHWSTYGAYWGTYDLFDYIAQKFPNAKPRTLDEMGFYTTEMYGGDVLFSLPEEAKFEKYYSDKTTKVTKVMELTTNYKLKTPTSTINAVYRNGMCLSLTDDNAPAAKEINSDADGLPTALIMRDSFSKVAYDIINDRFSTVYWGEFNNYNMPLEIVDTDKVDYVIYLYSERNLLKIMMNSADANILNLR